MEKIDLFDAGKGGYALYRIPGIVVTAKGTVLAYCEARRTGKTDWDTIDLMLRRSTDGGKTWSARRKIADVPGPKPKNPVALAKKLANPDDVTYNNPVAFADRNGAVHILFCLEYARCFYMCSDDDGQSFSAPVEITATFDRFRPEYPWKVLATGPGHGIQLRNGRLLVPVWLSTGTGGHAHRPSVTSVIYSDDHGKTWERGEIAVPNTPEWIFPNETTAVELEDGRVMLNVRTEAKANRRLVTISPDGATRWSTPRFDDQLLEPICMGSILRVSTRRESGRSRILFSNPHNLTRADGKEAPGVKHDRKNVSLKLSYDEGETWPVNKTLEPGFSGYSDLAALPDGTLLCFYERGSTDGKNIHNTAHLTLARFNLEWLTDGRDSLARRPGARGQGSGSRNQLSEGKEQRTPTNRLSRNRSEQAIRNTQYVSQVDVFRRGEDGYHTYRIPAVIATPRGDLLAFCEARKDSGGDSGNIDLVQKRSRDGGKTWGPLEVVWDDGPNTVGNPCPVVDRETGTIWLPLTRNLGEDNERAIKARTARGSREVWVTHSKDDGKTWARPVEITATTKAPDWTWYATGPGVGIQLRSGRLVIPCDHAEAGTVMYRSHVIYSDDHGKTWKRSGPIGDNTNECQVIERADGSLLMNMRSYHRQNRRALAVSRDGGDTWSEVTLDPALIEPVCQASVIKYPGRRGRKSREILFSNPASTKREKMTVRFSPDDGATWTAARELHAGPAAYSSLVTLRGGWIGCLYERGDQNPYEKVTFARFTRKWLTGESNSPQRR